jgi:hypothetical protein
MLGLGNALSTASSTSEQLYSLSLDGSGDYLNLGDVLDRGTGDFSVSFWAKVTHDDIDDQPFISKRDDNDNFWRIRTVNTGSSTAGKIYVIGKTGGVVAFAMTGDAVMDSFLNTWVHICVTVDRDGDGVIYVNGTTNTYGSTTNISYGSSVDVDNTADFEIGAFDGMTYVEGNMDEVAIWNVALDEDAVAALYNSGRPFDLNNDKGNYDNSSALQGYWRMGNGPFDDKANGVVHDAHNPGYGADLITNGTFDTDSDWTKETGWTISGGVASHSSGTNAMLYQTSILTAGKTYKITYDITSYTSGDVAAYTGNWGTNASAVGSYTDYLVATSTYLKFNASSVNDFVGSIDNVVCKELNGNPGLTAADAIFSTDTPDD